MRLSVPRWRRRPPRCCAGDRAVRSHCLPPVVTGNTVVSSVNRGPADLRFRCRAGAVDGRLPGAVADDGLTHGVRCRGDRGRWCTPSTGLSNVDEYLARLDAELG